MAPSLQPLELWAGIECTHNRVGNHRFDQLDRTGHRHRREDLDALAALGVQAVRYPVLWEHAYGDDGARADWAWHDDRLGRIRELGLRPVAGLLHHGAGPGDAGFVDPAFPERFAAYAREVAERYPWITDYVPINEPLTTARFCGLYGVWHPHAREAAVFARILLAQLRATVLAMRAIREVVPDARFIQTEDLGTIRAVPRLQYEADFQNERRWVTFDALSGALRPGATMWEVLVRAGAGEDELGWFAENPTPPDILALDNYITSDRFLDDRTDRYPEWSHGGNGTDRYTDIEAVRVTADEPPGVLPLLRHAWARYGRPLALGECHIGCTREEQLRWLRDCRAAAELVRGEGADVRSLTVWSVFGAYDWNTLVTEDRGYYESGAFDVRSGTPRPTAVASMVRALAAGEPFDHPALESDGWWRRDDRLTYPPVRVDAPVPYAEPPSPRVSVPDRRALVLAGPRSALVDAFRRVCEVRALHHRERLRREAPAQEWLERARAWAVIDVASCAATGAPTANGVGSPEAGVARVRALASSCAALGIPLVVVSCHHAALRTGRCGSLAAAREEAASGAGAVLVLRAGALFGPWDREDPLIARLAGRRRPDASDEPAVSPAYIPDVVNAALDLALDGERGEWDLHHGAECTWAEVAEAGAALAQGADPERFRDLGRHADGHRLPLPALVDALTRFVRESEPLWRDAIEPAPAEVVEIDSAPGFEYPAMEPASTLSRAEEAG